MLAARLASEYFQVFVETSVDVGVDPRLIWHWHRHLGPLTDRRRISTRFASLFMFVQLAVGTHGRCFPACVGVRVFLL